MPPFGKPANLNIKKPQDSEKSQDSSLNGSGSIQSPSKTPVSAGGGFASKLRSLSIAAGRKRSPSSSSKQSLLTNESNFLSFDLAQEKKFAIDDKKLNSLHKAVFDRDAKKVVKLMSESNRDLDKVDSVHGITALHLAVIMNSVPMVKALLQPVEASKKHADVNAASMKGRTPLMIAVINENLSLVKLLVESGASVQKMDEWNCRALHYALYNEKPDIFSFLVEAAVGLVQYTDSSNMTLLHHAARLGKSEMINILVNYGHDVNARDDLDRTPLHIAVKEKQVGAASMLLAHHANIDAQDMNCQSILDYFSYTAFNQDMWNVLQEYRDTNKSDASPEDQTASDGDASGEDPSDDSDMAALVTARKEIKQSEELLSRPSDTAPQLPPFVKDEDGLSSVVSISDHEDEEVTPATPVLAAVQVRRNSGSAQQDETKRQSGQSTNEDKRYSAMVTKFTLEIQSLNEKIQQERAIRQSLDSDTKKATEKLQILARELDELKVIQTSKDEEITGLKRQIAAGVPGPISDARASEMITQLESELKEKDDIIREMEATANYLTHRLEDANVNGFRGIRRTPTSAQQSQISLVTDSFANGLAEENKTLKDKVAQLEAALAQSKKSKSDSQSASKTEQRVTSFGENMVAVDQKDLTLLNDFIRSIKEKSKQFNRPVSDVTDSGYAQSPSSDKKGLQALHVTENILKTVQTMTENMNVAKETLETAIETFHDTPIIDVFSVQLATMHEVVSQWQSDSQLIESSISALKQIQKLDLGAHNGEIVTVSEVVAKYNSNKAGHNAKAGEDVIQSPRLIINKAHLLSLAGTDTIASPSSSTSDDKVSEGIARRRAETLIAKYEKEIYSLKDEIVRLKSAEQQVVSLQHQLTAKEAEYNKSLNVIKASLEADLRRLEEEVNTLKQEREKNAANAKRIQQALDKTRSDLENAQKLIAQEKMVAQQSVSKTTEQMEEVERQRAALILEVESLKAKYSKEHSEDVNKIKTIEKELAKALDQLQDVQLAEKTEAEQVQQLKATIQTLRDANEKAQTDHQQEIQSLEAEKQSRDNDVLDLKQQINHLQSRLAQLMQTNDSISATHAVLIQNRDKDIQDLNAQLDAAEKQRDRFANEKAMLQHTIDHKTKEMIANVSRIQELESQLDQERHQIMNLREQLAHASELEGRLERMTQERAQMQVFQGKSAQLASQLAVLQEQNDHKEQSIRELTQIKLELQTQNQQAQLTLIAHEKKLHENKVQLEVYAQKAQEAQQVEVLLQQQHEDTLNQLRKYGLDFSLTLQQQDQSILKSFELYLQAEKEARNAYDQQLVQLKEKHDEQLEVAKSTLHESQKRLALLEVKQVNLEKDLTERKVAYSVLQEKWNNLEAKFQDTLRSKGSLSQEIASLKSDHQLQLLSLQNKIERLDTENNKLKIKIQELVREHQSKLNGVSDAYESQIEKLIQRMQMASQQRLSMDQSRKKTHQALLDTYEHHIKTLTNELNTLRLTALKHQVTHSRRN